jgi:hypothetical protein
MLTAFTQRSSFAVEFLGMTSFPAFIWYDVKGNIIPVFN